MNVKLIRRWAVLLGSFVALGASSAIAIASPGYCDPLGGCNHHYLKLSPSGVSAGQTVALRGSVGSGCQTPGQVTIYSRAFNGATTHQFAGVPAVYATANRQGAFSKKVTIKRSVKRGSYHIGGRCGGGNFGSATLKVH